MPQDKEWKRIASQLRTRYLRQWFPIVRVDWRDGKAVQSTQLARCTNIYTRKHQKPEGGLERVLMVQFVFEDDKSTCMTIDEFHDHMNNREAAKKLWGG